MAKPVPFTNLEKTCKLCTKCQSSFPLESFSPCGQKVSGETKYNSWCKKCIAVKQATYHKRTWGPERLQYTSFKRSHSIRAYLVYLRSKAVSRKRECISVDALETLWSFQKGKCALTGWDMTFELGNGVIPTNCSIDRIDSSKGYEVGNVQLVCRAANTAKSNLKPSDFVALCRAVTETHRDV